MDLYKRTVELYQNVDGLFFICAATNPANNISFGSNEMCTKYIICKKSTSLIVVSLMWLWIIRFLIKNSVTQAQSLQAISYWYTIFNTTLLSTIM